MASEWEIKEAMRIFGGSFIQQFARLYDAADPVNQARLRAAFPDYWEQYRQITEARREPPVARA
jgi:hypothetical protein